MKKILIIILLSLFVPLFTARAFSLSPLRYVFAVAGGETVEVPITLINYEAETVALEPAIVGIKVDKNGRSVFDNTAELVVWAKADWNLITLKEGGEKKVKFFVTVPIGTYPGDYYLGVGARRGATGKTAVNIGEQLLAVVNLKVAGQAREDLVVKKFENDALFYDKNKKFNLEIANAGNVEVPIAGVLKITDWRGRVIGERSVRIGDKILPLATRVASVDFTVAGTFSLPGLYQADLVIDYGLTKQKITAVEKFWYWPVWALVAAVALLAIIIAAVLSGRRRNGSI